MTSFKLIAFIFALLLGSYAVRGQQSGFSRCGPNQYFDRCGKSPACQRSCEQSGGSICITLCVPTCMCRGDRVRNRFNQCVPLRECRRGRTIF